MNVDITPQQAREVAEAAEAILRFKRGLAYVQAEDVQAGVKALRDAARKCEEEA